MELAQDRLDFSGVNITILKYLIAQFMWRRIMERLFWLAAITPAL
jgi:hypothetical protein